MVNSNRISLTIQADKFNNRFSDEINQTNFTIFDHLSDLGYFSWDPKDSRYKSLDDISSSEEILSHIDLNGKPNILMPVQRLKTPKKFEHPPAREIINKFPFGQIDIGCLYAAVKVSLHNTIQVRNLLI